jgi:predicted ATPase/DNA-binding SARP family transcriptional activator
VRVAMLGPLVARSGDGRPIEVGGARLRALLIRLALEPGRPVSVDALVDGLWGASPPAGAVNALQSLVSRLRRALQPAGPAGTLLSSEPAGYRLDVDRDQVDAHRFERLALQGHADLEAGAPDLAAGVLQESLALWRGPALADALDAPFAAAPAARLEELRRAALEDLLEAKLALGRHAEVLAELEALVAEHPLRERLRGQQMRALYGAGRQAEALAVYQATRRALAEELGVDPAPELEAVHLAMLRRDPGLAVRPAVAGRRAGGDGRGVAAGGGPAGNGDTKRTNLRAQLTTFVGRDREVERVGELVAGSRLVTLVGPGGSGKTRLAAESATRLLDRLPDGAWMVELAPLHDPLDLPHALLAALGAVQAPGLEPAVGEPGGDLTVEGLAWREGMARLVERLRPRRLLLVLDNCEHLVAAVARLADELLAACPELRVLATSREPLGITGETLCPVPPLPVPPEGATLLEARRFPAVRLLADRAVAVRPGFSVEDANLAAVTAICRRLDGMPLAIELAAARLRSLQPEQLAERLDDRFRLLTGGSRTSLPRHQTLRAVVDWSWELLAEPERVLARRLAAFPGGATIESAEAVCAWGALRADEVIDLLAALVDKSLLEVSVEGRYRMLETVRAYAAERLDEAGEAAEAGRRHAAWFLALAERADPRLRGAGQLEWLARLRAEEDNLLAALRWAVKAQDAQVALRLGVALGWYWVLSDNHAQAVALLGEALALPPERLREAPRDVLALAYGYLALHSSVLGDTAGGQRAFASATEAGRELDPATSHPMAGLLRPIIDAFLTWQHHGEAAMHARIASELEHPDPWIRAAGRLARGIFAANLGGDHDVSERDLLAALERFEQVGDRWGVSIAASGLAEARSLRGDHRAAVTTRELALRLMGELTANGNEVVEARVRLGVERGRAGDLDAARADLEQALREARRNANAPLEAFALGGLAELHGRAGDLDQARAGYRLGLARLADGSFSTLSLSAMRAPLLFGLGHIAVLAGEPDDAEAHYREAFALCTGTPDLPLLAEAIDGLAEAAFAGGDAGRAATLLGAGIAVRGAPNHSQPEMVALAERVRERLGTDAYRRASARGAAMTRDAALAYAAERPARAAQARRR